MKWTPRADRGVVASDLGLTEDMAEGWQALLGEIPTPIQWAIFGGELPAMSIPGMRTLESAWRACAERLDGCLRGLESTHETIADVVSGSAGPMLTDQIGQLVSRVSGLRAFCHGMADQCGQTAADTEKNIWEMVIFGLVASYQVAFLVTSGGIGAVPGIAMLAKARATFLQMLERCVFSLGLKGAAATAARAGLIGIAFGIGSSALDLGLQGIQIAQGNRDHIDGKSVAIMGLQGLGAVGGGHLGVAFASKAAPMLGRATMPLVAAAGGVFGVVGGAVVAIPVTGQFHLTGSALFAGIAQGVAGGLTAVGPHPRSPQDPHIPGGGGRRNTDTVPDTPAGGSRRNTTAPDIADPGGRRNTDTPAGGGRRNTTAPDIADVRGTKSEPTPEQLRPGDRTDGGTDATSVDALPTREHPMVRGHDIADEFDHSAIAELSRHQPESDPADPALAAIYRHQGFNGLPTVTNQHGVDAAVAAGGTELFRGVTDPRFADDFREGDYFAGKSAPGIATGNGTYVTTKRESALDYSDGQPDGVVRMALRPDARLTDIDQLHTEHAAATRAIRSRRDVLEGLPQTPEVIAEKEKLRNQQDVFLDLGRFAATRGYDAYSTHGSNSGYGDQYWVVLNRTALVVEHAPPPTTGPVWWKRQSGQVQYHHRYGTTNSGVKAWTDREGILQMRFKPSSGVPSEARMARDVLATLGEHSSAVSVHIDGNLSTHSAGELAKQARGTDLGRAAVANGFSQVTIKPGYPGTVFAHFHR